MISILEHQGTGRVGDPIDYCPVLTLRITEQLCVLLAAQQNRPSQCFLSVRIGRIEAGLPQFLEVAYSGETVDQLLLVYARRAVTCSLFIRITR